MSSAVTRAARAFFASPGSQTRTRHQKKVLGFEPPGLQLPRDAPGLVHVRQRLRISAELGENERTCVAPDQFGAWLGHQARALDGDERFLQRVGETQLAHCRERRHRTV